MCNIILHYIIAEAGLQGLQVPVPENTRGFPGYLYTIAVDIPRHQTSRYKMVLGPRFLYVQYDVGSIEGSVEAV